MEFTLTQKELKVALLEALLDYETFKKTRRLNSLKKTLQGTMIATLISSTGVLTANQGRNNQVKEKDTVVNVNTFTTYPLSDISTDTKQNKYIPGIAHFGFNKHRLASSQQARLLQLINQLPKDLEVSVIGRTDSTGNTRYNEKLGKLRAQAVARVLEQYGVKIKAIDSKSSSGLTENWMKRRVDIIVHSAHEPILLNNTTGVNPVVADSTSKPGESRLNQNALQYSDKSLINKASASAANDKIAEISSQETIVKITSPGVPEFPVYKRQVLRGVSHFASTNHELTWAHKERLIELIKQLPKSAELTVIGRTESNGQENVMSELGMQRAKTVANFLASFGVKVKAVGSRQSSDNFTGWGARRVDIVVDSGPTSQIINLSQPLQEEYSAKNEAEPVQTVPARTAQHGPYIYNVN